MIVIFETHSNSLSKNQQTKNMSNFYTKSFFNDNTEYHLDDYSAFEHQLFANTNDKEDNDLRSPYGRFVCYPCNYSTIDLLLMEQHVQFHCGVTSLNNTICSEALSANRPQSPSYNVPSNSNGELYSPTSQNLSAFEDGIAEFFWQLQNNSYDLAAIEAELMKNYEIEASQTENLDLEFSNVDFGELKQLHSCNLTPNQLQHLNPVNILEDVDESELWQHI